MPIANRFGLFKHINLNITVNVRRDSSDGEWLADIETSGTAMTKPNRDRFA